MPVKSELEAWFKVDPRSSLDRLAKTEGRDAAFVSCYLDMSAGKAACHAFLKRKVTSIRRSLTGLERFEFDCATEMIHGALQSEWNPQAQGMIIFARGVAKDRHLDVLHAGMPVDNRLVRYCKPEILPLVALHQREPAFTLLVANREQLQLFERRPGSLTGPALLHAIPRHTDTENILLEVGAGQRPTNPRQEAQRRFYDALCTSTLPLLIAGDTEELTDAADWLPQTVIDRLVGTLPYAREDGLQALLHAARAQIRSIGTTESDRLARLVIEHEIDPAHAVTGYRSTLQAIRQGLANTVVIADWDQPGLGLPWEEEIGICHEAMRSGARIVLSDSLQLREAGGVGCLLDEQYLPGLAVYEGSRIGLQRAA